MANDYTATVRLYEDEKDEFINLMVKCAEPFAKEGKSVQPTVLMRDLIKAQLSNIKEQGGTMFHYKGERSIKVVC